MEDFAYKLLEQTPLVIVLVLGIYYFTKQIEKKEKEFGAERKMFRQTKELNAYVHKESKHNSDALIKLAESIDDFIEK